MALHVFVFLLAVCLLLSLARLGRLCWFHLRSSHSRGGAIHSTAYSHQLKAHSTASCSSNWAELGCVWRVFI
jgi:hypothetical protein